MAVNNKYSMRYDYQSTKSNVQEISPFKNCQRQTIPKPSCGLPGSSVRFETLSPPTLCKGPAGLSWEHCLLFACHRPTEAVSFRNPVSSSGCLFCSAGFAALLVSQESLQTQCLESSSISCTEPPLSDKSGSRHLCSHHHATVHGPYSSQEPHSLCPTFQGMGNLPLAALLKATPSSLLSPLDTWHSLFNESYCRLQLEHSALLQPIPEPGEHKNPVPCWTWQVRRLEKIKRE